MPDNYHYLPHEFRRMPQPNLHMNPQFTNERRSAKEDLSHAALDEAPDAYDSLLQHRVPSASLYLEEMMARWPISTSSRSQYILTFPGSGTERSSIATLIDFGEWISGQCHDRPPSLLPPAPQLVRLPSFDIDKVECRLSSPTTPPHKQRENTDRTTKRKQLQNLSAQLQEVSFSTGNASSPPTRPITPVPSLTTSNCSRSSSLGFDISPCTTRRSPKAPLLSQPLGSNVATASRNPMEVTANGPRIFKIGAPLPSPIFLKDDKVGWSNLPVDPSRNSSYLPFRPVPIPNTNVISMHQPHSSIDSQEVSYIEWDDDKRGDSALGRFKKSLTDLRATERYITEANSRNKMEAARAVKEASESAFNHKSSDTGGTSQNLVQVPSGQRETHRAAPARLQKKASAKTISTLARSSKTDSSRTPPSTGKRKPMNTTSSQQSSEIDKTKPKCGTVATLVRRLLGARK